jgi:hypothetical protein
LKNQEEECLATVTRLVCNEELSCGDGKIQVFVDLKEGR